MKLHDHIKSVSHTRDDRPGHIVIAGEQADVLLKPSNEVLELGEGVDNAPIPGPILFSSMLFHYPAQFKITESGEVKVLDRKWPPKEMTKQDWFTGKEHLIEGFKILRLIDPRLYSYLSQPSEFGGIGLADLEIVYGTPPENAPEWVKKLPEAEYGLCTFDFEPVAERVLKLNPEIIKAMIDEYGNYYKAWLGLDTEYLIVEVEDEVSDGEPGMLGKIYDEHALHDGKALLKA